MQLKVFYVNPQGFPVNTSKNLDKSPMTAREYARLEKAILQGDKEKQSVRVWVTDNYNNFMFEV